MYVHNSLNETQCAENYQPPHVQMSTVTISNYMYGLAMQIPNHCCYMNTCVRYDLRNDPWRIRKRMS